MKQISNRKWLLAAAVFAIACTTLALTEIVICPWHEVPQLGGDGGKNIFTYLYHILYDKGLWFTGMNYPYGEHIVFTDGQPLLSVLLSSLGHTVTIETALTIMWWLVALSYVLAIIYCFKILTHYQVKPVLAMCFAGLIVLFSPQLLRVSGHYALSYCCVLPMLFYWTIQYSHSQQWKYPLRMFVLGSFTTFLHPYYAAVALVWVGAYSVGYFIFYHKTFVAKVRHILPLLISVFCVFGLFWVFMKLTDPVTDRPTTPFGILENGTHIKDIFSSVYTPVWNYIYERHLFGHISAGGEGYCYTGVAIMVTLCLSFVMGFRNKLKNRSEYNIVSNNGFQPVWLFMAFGVLLFSMGVPFTWHLDWLLRYASLLRQFRTLGRFSWIYYYIIAIYGSVVISHWLERCKAQKQTFKGYLLLFLFLGIWLFEASGYVMHTRKVLALGRYKYGLLVSKNEQNWPQFLATHRRQQADFQAILVLPYFETGSEKLWVCSDETRSAIGLELGVKAGIQLHLPMIDVMMSRSSWSEAFKQAKIAGGPYTSKPMLRDLPNDKPFLLLNQDNDTLLPDQQYLLAASDSIGHFLNCSVYACYPDRIKKNDATNHTLITAMLPNLAIGDTCLHYSGRWMVNHFDTGIAQQKLFSPGAAAYRDIDSYAVNIISVQPMFPNQLYEFSCWFLLSDKDYKSPSFLIETLDDKGNVLTTTETYTKESTDNFGMWFRNELVFPLPAPCRAVRCWLKNMPADSYIAMDELMLRPVDALIISKGKDGAVMVNNHLLYK